MLQKCDGCVTGSGLPQTPILWALQGFFWG